MLKGRINPGELNRKLVILRKSIINDQEYTEELFTTWGKKVVKTKRRDEEQNTEKYEFIVRKREIKEYYFLSCEGQFFDILTVEESRNGFITLTCEKSKIHTYYDKLTVKRLDWIENENKEDVEKKIDIYSDIPCQLIKNQSGGTNETDQQNEIDQQFKLHLETKYNLELGDSLEVQHLQDQYEFTVVEFFRNHTFQEVILKLDGEA